MKTNKHEEMFEKLCAEQKLKFKKIPATRRTKTPDYVLLDNDGAPLAAIEIKALQETDFDKDIKSGLKSIFILEAGSDTADDIVIFEKTRKDASLRRIREYIRQANDQFRYLKSNIPGILVLYSERISTCFEISENLLDRSADGDSYLLVDQSLGGIVSQKTNGRTLRPNKNQLVSAVIAPQESGEIIVKINDYANSPFPQGLFKNVRII